MEQTTEQDTKGQETQGAAPAPAVATAGSGACRRQLASFGPWKVDA